MKYPWIGTQCWESPVFMHWPVPYDTLRSYVPAPFQIDTFNGQAWIGVVPFKAEETSPRWGSGLFSLGPIWQLNIRTYIRFFEEPAVYFLTVFTNSKLSVTAASALLSLPYHNASFHSTKSANSVSLNMKQANKEKDAYFSMVVHPSNECYKPDKHSLEYWLTERYHFYSIKGKQILKASISHNPWTLQKVDHETTYHNIMDLVPENKSPLVHLGTSQKTFIYPPQVKGFIR